MRLLKHSQLSTEEILANLKLLDVEIKKNRIFFECPWRFAEETEKDIIQRITELKNISNVIIDLVTDTVKIDEEKDKEAENTLIKAGIMNSDSYVIKRGGKIMYVDKLSVSVEDFLNRLKEKFLSY